MSDLTPTPDLSDSGGPEERSVGEEKHRPGEGSAILGKYFLIKPIGFGGMGEVWLAKDRHGNEVAVKQLTPRMSGSADQRKRLIREARMLSRLQHRNICRLYGVEVIDEKPHLIMGISRASLSIVCCGTSAHLPPTPRPPARAVQPTFRA